MAEKVKLKRVRKLSYTVNFPTESGGIRTYVWAGSKGNRYDVKEVPLEVFDWLSFNTSTFKDGELKIIDDTPEVKELVETLPEKEEYEANSNDNEQIEKLLKGSIANLKKGLEKITSSSEKRNVIDYAREVKDDLPNGKLKAIAEWAGKKQDVLFGDDE